MDNATKLRAIDLAWTMFDHSLSSRRSRLGEDNAATLCAAALALANAHRAATVGDATDDLVRRARRAWTRTHARIAKRTGIGIGSVAALDFELHLVTTRMKARALAA